MAESRRFVLESRVFQNWIRCVISATVVAASLGDQSRNHSANHDLRILQCDGVCVWHTTGRSLYVERSIASFDMDMDAVASNDTSYNTRDLATLDCLCIIPIARIRVVGVWICHVAVFILLVLYFEIMGICMVLDHQWVFLMAIATIVVFARCEVDGIFYMVSCEILVFS
jgi:hypothetical protein